jgi:hypothetical protein
MKEQFGVFFQEPSRRFNPPEPAESTLRTLSPSRANASLVKDPKKEFKIEKGIYNADYSEKLEAKRRNYGQTKSVTMTLGGGRIKELITRESGGDTT